jgi:uncharacterized protein YbbK (DUF523 family)
VSDPPIIVSACLLGVKCRFDGADSYNKSVAEESGLFIPVCPEQLGGLPTPRAKAEITTGTGTDVIEGRSFVKDSEGADITERFLAGAKEVLKIARLVGAREAILKEKSPSCGVGCIKRGEELIEGPGVTTALLKREGIIVEGR